MKKFKIKYLFGILRLILIKFINLNKFNIKGFRYFIGKNVDININGEGMLSIDDKVYLSNNCKIECDNANIEIGFNNYFNSYCKIVALDGVKIGDNNIFGPNVSIYDHNHKYESNDILICKQGFNTSKVNIGSNVWIAANVVITKGVNIGDRVVVGANSVVTNSLESNGLYAGSPAKLIKKI